MTRRGVALSHMPHERKQIELELPKISSMKDIVATNDVVFNAIAQGQLSPGSAKVICELIASQMRAIGTAAAQSLVMLTFMTPLLGLYWIGAGGRPRTQLSSSTKPI